MKILYQLIKQREENRKSTIYTTQYSPDEWGRRIICFTIFNLNIYLAGWSSYSTVQFTPGIPLHAPTINALVAKYRPLAAPGYTSAAGRKPVVK